MNRRIEHLSLAALRMAASGLSEAPDVVAQWLYRFGTVPRGPAVDRDFGPDDDPMAVLGLTVGGGARRRLETAYEASSLPGWYSFARAPGEPQMAAACKLYVSPMPQALADAFAHIVDALVRCEVRSFKVGRGIEGLLRPDKIIAYFDDHAHMQSAAGALGRSLSGCPAQGVPFTTGAGEDGLLSSGVDPPAGNAASSWRSWVTKQLAQRLAVQRASRADNPVAAVLADMRSTGVDPQTWRANADAFRDEGAP